MGKPRVHVNAGPVGVSIGLLPLLAVCGAFAAVGLVVALITAVGSALAARPLLGLVVVVAFLGFLAAATRFFVLWHRRELERLGRR
jgi:hypothetical protein